MADRRLAERNEFLARRLLEVRERVVRFMDSAECEDSAAAREQLARDILNFTTLQ